MTEGSTAKGSRSFGVLTGWFGLGCIGPDQGRKEGRVKLGLCASLLALSSIDGWVSCNEEVP